MNTNTVLSFENTPGLGDVVTQTKCFCKLTKNMQVPSYEYIVGDFYNPDMHGLIGHKWSRLCGFSFMSNVDSANPLFQFVYVPKLRGTLNRNNKGLSGWYCWSYVANDNRIVMSIDDMMSKYHFNVNAFVYSDLFDNTVPKFISNITVALNNQVKQLIDSTTNTEKKMTLQRYVKQIKESLLKIYEVKHIVTWDEVKRDDEEDEEINYAVRSNPKAGHAKIAYNGDKTYGLKNLDKDARLAKAQEIVDKK